MAVSATVTSGKIFQDGETVTISELNKLGSPTVDIAGAVGNLSLEDGSVSNAKVAASAGIQLNKLETGSGDAQIAITDSGSSNEFAPQTVTGDVNITNAGVTSLTTDSVVTANITNESVTEDKLIAAVVNKLLPPGLVAPYIKSAAAPTGWLYCDGSEQLQSAYPDLWEVILHGYGTAANPSTHFVLPDLRGRVPVGVDGSAARLSANDALGDDGGDEEVVISASQLPEHTHPNTPTKTESEVTLNSYGNPWIKKEGGGYVAEAGTPSAASAMHSGYGHYGFSGSIFTIKHTPSLTVDANVTDNVGTNLLQPYQIFEYIIKT